MIYTRQENIKFGTYDTVQTFYTCDHCKNETNGVEWFTRITPAQATEVECPVCKTNHVSL